MDDDCFNALTSEHKRTLLVALLAENPPSTKNPIPAGGETETSDSDQQWETTMYHVHLPKLDDYGFIRWDADSHEIVKGPRFEEIRPLIEFLDSSDASQ